MDNLQNRQSKTLVAFASKHGSTAEIAQAIGAALTEMGVAADVRPAREVGSLAPYSAVIVGSVVQMGRWQGDAIDFLKRFERDLAARPTWLFSSGPTGGSPEGDVAVARAAASPDAIPAPKDVAQRAARIGARGHATFPGKVGPEVGGIFARWVPKGDWRDFDAIKAWARGIGAELRRAAPVAR